ncbi:response regulator [Hydrogenimonas thermophila]|uniref:response regulator n=1 Tax=Hydrogenimonas thermophila TaxID=223786 RepID=UPI00293716CB|nr:response regulator [Hydrogenimonas thermophila]WOE70743.1 response regulator [Hydrogenimonas thermophila]WOE73260.1 response regulator [Hydrogenimonas thermophila]
MLDKNITKKLKSYTENLSILFVDDEEAARESIYGLLKTLFKNVYIAENGQEGLNIFEKEYPDIVLTDLRMPIMDGLKMIEEIRKIKPEQKIVAQSAHGDSQIILETVFMGIDGYILKPIKSDQIINTLYKIAKLVIMEKENTKYRLNLEELVAKQVDQIKQQTESLINQLRTDHLTRLPNKEQLNIDFKEFSPDVMIFLNIDNFDQINLYYGFEVGDLLLIEFASFLRKLLDSNKLYRINGDEFAILIKEFTLSEAKSIAENIHNSIYNNYFLVNGLSLCITVTIGIIPIDKTLKKPPFGNAHLAIKKARETHKNSIEIFKPEFILELKRKKVIEWTQKAKIALDSNLYQPFFQPIINLKSNKIEKYECLARIVENESVDSPYLFIY